MEVEQLQRSAEEACQFLRLLANPDRLLLLCQLLEGERCVGELEDLTGIYQPTLSQQLAVLRRDQLVSTRRAGKQVYYQVADPRVMVMLRTLHRLFCEVEHAH